MSILQSLLEELAPSIDMAKREHKAMAKNGELFNIFPILRKPHDEEFLHTAFLAEMLDPNGSHGQGTDFLRLFIETCNIKIDGFDIGSIELYKEKHIGNLNGSMTEGGKVDLLIESNCCAIVIENKIFADDQENQLLRYHNHLKSTFSNYKVLYLTLFGNAATSKSVGSEPFEYTRISYNRDIVAWLENCIKRVQNKPMIKAIVQQYVNLIKELTTQPSLKTMKTKILEILKSNDKYFDCADELLKVLTQLKLDVASNLEKVIAEKVMGTHRLSNNKQISCQLIVDRDGVCICIDLLDESGKRNNHEELRGKYSSIFKNLFPKQMKSNKAYICWYNPKNCDEGKKFVDLPLQTLVEMQSSEEKFNIFVTGIIKEYEKVCDTFINRFDEVINEKFL